MLTKTTHVYANHGLDLECDIYEAPGYPTSNPVVLFFHSGGLVGFSREYVPPWLVQMCLQRKWPLISASYRFLPQAGAKGLLDDASAAYEFARTWKSESRSVVASGASAGFFMAALLGHHVNPKPVALLSITGIPTFRHPFFSSSTLLTPRPITEAEMAQHMNGPAVAGKLDPNHPMAFAPDKLTPAGAKNPAFVAPKPTPWDPEKDGWTRGCLYDYYLYWNKFIDLVGEVDPGYGTPENPAPAETRQKWPTTVIIQGDDDYDVSMDVSVNMADSMGEEKVKLFLASGQGHLFESASYLEDEKPEMETVREAIKCLDSIVGAEVGTVV